MAHPSTCKTTFFCLDPTRHSISSTVYPCCPWDDRYHLSRSSRRLRHSAQISLLAATTQNHTAHKSDFLMVRGLTFELESFWLSAALMALGGLLMLLSPLLRVFFAALPEGIFSALCLIFKQGMRDRTSRRPGAR